MERPLLPTETKRTIVKLPRLALANTRLNSIMEVRHREVRLVAGMKMADTVMLVKLKH